MSSLTFNTRVADSHPCAWARDHAGSQRQRVHTFRGEPRCMTENLSGVVGLQCLSKDDLPCVGTELEDAQPRQIDQVVVVGDERGAASGECGREMNRIRCPYLAAIGCLGSQFGSQPSNLVVNGHERKTCARPKERVVLVRELDLVIAQWRNQKLDKRDYGCDRSDVREGFKKRVEYCGPRSMLTQVVDQRIRIDVTVQGGA